ncbi:MAG: hypothetical protein IJU78_07015 [Clostridia bacterium]|nr:hypothetical protein [Clostridia bacterium]
MRLFPDPYDLGLPYEYRRHFVGKDGDMIEERAFEDYGLFNTLWWYGGGLWYPPAEYAD